MSDNGLKGRETKAGFSRVEYNAAISSLPLLAQTQLVPGSQAAAFREKLKEKDKLQQQNQSQGQSKEPTKTQKKGKKQKSAYRPKRWFWGKKYQSFDPLIPEVPPIVEGPISFLEQYGMYIDFFLFFLFFSFALFFLFLLYIV